jgi:hypothetical protein
MLSTTSSRWHGGKTLPILNLVIQSEVTFTLWLLNLQGKHILDAKEEAPIPAGN